METICINNGEIRLPKCVATLGVFDGVHKGHQHLIGMVAEQARVSGLRAAVVTFDRPPRQVLDASFHPQLLTTLEEKRDIISQMGVDYLVVLPFTKALAALTAREFMQQILHKQLNAAVLITGYDNRFGHHREEGFDDYVRYGEEMGMQVMRGDAELMTDGKEAVSSSIIRQLLLEGHVELMPQCLTRLYQLSGKVMPGEHIGHSLGFPTANLELPCSDKLIPAPGVYAVWAMLEKDRQQRAAMMNIGTRPTFEGKGQTLEVNIFDFDGDLYGQEVDIAFVARLREERRFDSPEALVAQLQEDKKQVKDILG